MQQKCPHMMHIAVHLHMQAWHVNCPIWCFPITWGTHTNHIQEFCYSFNLLWNNCNPGELQVYNSHRYLWSIRIIGIEFAVTNYGWYFKTYLSADGAVPIVRSPEGFSSWCFGKLSPHISWSWSPQENQTVIW